MNRHYLDRSLATIEGYLGDMKSARPALPPRSTVFFANVPPSLGWQAGDGPLLRWAYRDPSGIIYIVAGGGGRYLYDVAQGDPLIRSAYSVFHTMAIDVVGDSLYARAVLPDGRVFDSFSIVKNVPTVVEVPAAPGAPKQRSTQAPGSR